MRETIDRPGDEERAQRNHRKSPKECTPISLPCRGIEHQDRCSTRWQENQGREFRTERQPRGDAELRSRSPGRLAQPQRKRIEGAAKHGSQRDVGGGYGGVRQHCRQQGEDGGGKERCRRAEEPLRPQEHDYRSDNKVGQYTDAAESQVAPIVSVRRQDRVSISPSARFYRVHACEIRAQRNRDSRERSMLGLDLIDAFLPPLDTTRNMGRLIDGVVEYVIGRDDPPDSDCQQECKTQSPSCRMRKNARSYSSMVIGGLSRGCGMRGCDFDTGHG